MAQGLYELLGVPSAASREEVRDAYQRRLADLVRRLRVARQQGADVSILESQETALREAMEILSDPSRRRRYDAFRSAAGLGLPEDVESLWGQSRGALVDPVAGVSLAVVRALTDLPVGDPIPEPPGGWRRGRRRAEGAAATPPPSARPAPAGPGEPEPPLVAVPAPPVRPPDDLGATDPHIGLDQLKRRGLTDAPLPQAPLERDRSPEPHEDIRIAPAPAVPSDPVEALLAQHGTDGAFLRGVRQLRGMDLEALGTATRISTRYLGAIEENGFDRLPAATFVRGYLKQVVAVLEVADRGVVEGYMALYSQHR
ncbi:MAG: helix-turn-helix domain-containing protein [Myxococcota bacterium]|nr:helix-turn-helix domain-containing protein [Myxococcota bacterium]MEC8422485.1 helix-turn-helix domain-containing protein [Myxococcota bacterium]